MQKINLRESFARFDDCWTPHVVGELNGQYVKLTKLDGEFVWHSHEHEDELFLVVEGELEIHLRDQLVTLSPGEFFIVPRGVEHKPVANGLTQVLLFEPKETVNTGDAQDERKIDPEALKRL